jgi:hypothetical protein
VDVDGAHLRLFRFVPVRTAFDEILRDQMIPDLCRLPGLLDVHGGRQGPGDLGRRVIASIWATGAEMREGVGESFDEGRFHPEHLDETTERELTILPILVRTAREPMPRSGILRLARGRVRPGELAAYGDDVLAGTERDARAGYGPCTLVLAGGEDDRFMTFSVWPDWAAIEHATGSDIQRPITTRQPERIIEWSVEFYERLPDLPRPGGSTG